MTHFHVTDQDPKLHNYNVTDVHVPLSEKDSAVRVNH